MKKSTNKGSITDGVHEWVIERVSEWGPHFLSLVCFGWWPCGNPERLVPECEWAGSRSRTTEETKQQECILEGQVQLTLKLAIQSYALSTAYCARFLWRQVIKECITANMRLNIHRWNVHVCADITEGFAWINPWIQSFIFMLMTDRQ